MKDTRLFLQLAGEEEMQAGIEEKTTAYPQIKSEKKSSHFIVVEGLEGAGKTTAIQGIKKYLETQGVRVVLTREPGGTKVGEALRSLIKDKHLAKELNAWPELLLMYAARVQLVEEVIKPALTRGDWVIADRFELSSYAYQGGGRGIEDASISALSQLCLQGFQPDLILFLDLHPEQGLKRIKARGESDRIEEESLDFFSKTAAAYQRRIKKEPKLRCIDASLSLVEVEKNIIKTLDEFLSEETEK